MGRKTALVTGASSGVGVEFARQLGKLGYDLILTARRFELLQQVRDEIGEKSSVHIELIECDLGTDHGAEDLVDATRDFDVEFLVNNAGLGIYRPGLEHSLKEIDNMILVNCRSLTVLTRMFAERMVASGNGRILNHASFAGVHPSPWYSVYSGTKAYVVDFSTTMNFELLGTGVSITTLCPGFFRSEFQDKSGRKPGAFGKKVILEPDYIARLGIEGAIGRRSIVIPGMRYKLLNLLVRMFPRSLTMRAANWLVQS